MSLHAPPIASPQRESRRASTPGRRTVGILLLAILAALLPAAPASAQRVRDVFPDPLSGADLDEIGRRIGMSDFQRLAVDPAHIQYLDGYRDLRERELEPFLTDLLVRGRTFFFNPDPQFVREIIRRLERSERRIETLDNELFAAFDQVLAGDQRSMMPLVRKRRELDRLNSGFIRGMGSALPATTTDYGRIIDRLDLTPAEREQLEPLVFDYENRVAAARRRVLEQGKRVLVELVEEASRLYQQVLAGGEIGPEAANIWIQLRQTAFEKAKPVLGDLVDLARMNRDVLNQWGPLLSPQMAEQLRTIHYQYGYGEALDVFIRVREAYDRALRLPSVDAGTKTQLQAMRMDLVQRSFRMIERLESDAFDAIRAATFIIEDEDAEEFRKLTQRYEELEAICGSSREALEAILGEERMALLGQPEDEGGPVSVGPDPLERLLKAPSPKLLARQPDVGALDVADAAFDTSGPFLAAAISERELDWFASILALDDVQREMLDAIWLDHLDQFETFQAQHIAPMREMMKLIPNRGDRSLGAGAMTPEAAAATFPPAWAAADEALAAMDEAFFGDLELIVLDPADPTEAASMPAVRGARERVRLAVGTGRQLGGWAGRMARSADANAELEYLIDLDLLLVELPAASADGDLNGGTSDLQDYARERGDALQVYRTAWRTYADLLHRMAAAPPESQRDGTFWQQMAAPAAAVSDSRRALVTLNRRTLERLERSRSDGAGALRDRYQRTAFPSVYDDEQSAEGPLLAALILPDLGPAQQDRIQDIVTLYRPRHQELCTEMVDARMAASMAGSGRRNWQARSARANRIEQFTFDREELNARTLRALRATLDPVQASEVGFARPAS